MDSEWPFDQEKNVAAITSVNIIDKGYPILVVRHYKDDHSWGFFCGITEDVKDGKVIGMGEIYEKDKTLKEIADLSVGWIAYRKYIHSKWIRVKANDIKNYKQKEIDEFIQKKD